MVAQRRRARAKYPVRLAPKRSAESLKYFMPDWNDVVDPFFDFASDLTRGRRVAVQDQSYAHELLDPAPYDGVLVSRAVIETSKHRFEQLQRSGAHDFFRLKPGMEVFGDCGAFSYVNEWDPRYTTDDVLDYYQNIGVDYGVSVDHVVVPSIMRPGADGGTRKVEMAPGERDRRVELTLENAREFLKVHRRHRYRFTPVGVAQGWDAATYARSVRQLLKYGFCYIALGGLARSSRRKIEDVLVAVGKVREEHAGAMRLHLFGVAPLTLAKTLEQYGVRSIDSSSYLRKAWLRSGQNYLGVDRQWYTAIRVPQSYHPKVKARVATTGVSWDEVRTLEAFCLRQLERLGSAPLPSREHVALVDALVRYDTFMVRQGSDGASLQAERVLRTKYERTLQERPWEKCQCSICHAIGIHTLIFRGANRNRRRGFHNTWVFYNILHPKDK